MYIENIFKFIIMNTETIFKFVVIFFIFYFLFKVNSENFADTTTISAEMKTAINTIYEADVGAIRTLSQIATSLNNDVGGLTIPGPITVNKNSRFLENIATNSMQPNNIPKGWTGGIRTYDIYASGTIGVGPDGEATAKAFMANDGRIGCTSMNTGNAVINGNANVTGQLTTKSQIDAVRKDGRTTHFDFTDGKNYIRGDTQHDNNLTVGALTLRNGNWTEGAVEVSAQEGMYGNWTGVKMCPAGTYVCGLNTRFEGYQRENDDTALNGIRMQCCKF